MGIDTVFSAYQHHTMQTVINADMLTKKIVPDVSAAYQKSKQHCLGFGIGAAVSFAVMILFVILIFATGEQVPIPGWESHWEIFGSGPTELHPNMACVPFIIIGAICFIVFLILTIVNSVDMQKLKILSTLVNEIKAHDKISLQSLSISSSLLSIAKASVIVIINKLIETRNLDGYEVIGEVGVALISIRARERDFAVSVGQTTVYQEDSSKNNRCTGCGSPITRSSGQFCEFCGTRLN